MPKDVFYFKHDDNASSDFKLKALRKKYGWEGMGPTGAERSGAFEGERRGMGRRRHLGALCVHR